MKRWSLALLLVAGPAWADDEPVVADDEEVIEIRGKETPGSDFSIGEDVLEQYERDDIHHVLSAVPGVYIREEEGYGLRPNIGMRGSGSERSSKIALMEDGIPIAPAPYSAPAAYFFPLVTRMERVDVLKGPSAIQHGPNTVGGSVNLITGAMPMDRASLIDIAGGQNLYGKLHLRHTEGTDTLGAQFEYVKLRADGFKTIDGGGDTGFDKNDLHLRLRWNTPTSGATFHRIELRGNYSDELSNETYTGLSNADLAAAPYRRYAGTHLDRLDWDRVGLALTYEYENSWLKALTQAYRNKFDRTWRRLAGFAGNRDLRSVLANPDAGANAVFYSVLTGQVDSTDPSESLLLATNSRRFVSQGIQTRAESTFNALGMNHKAQLGLRFHHDEVDRVHSEDAFAMREQRLTRDGTDTTLTRDALGTTYAFAGFLENQASLGDWTFTLGSRTEVIRTRWRDRQDTSRNNKDTHVVFIPGAGVYGQVLPWLGVLAGVHKGFVPGAPSPSGTAKPEESFNYELGARLTTRPVRAEVIGFFNDYQNLKGTCTFSSGCMDNLVDEEFAGGSVHVAGVEAHAQATPLSLGSISFPVELTYTFTHSEFQTGFLSNNPQWGNVEAGYELPYLPAHLLSANVGAAGKHWDFNVSVRHTGSMRDIAGDSPLMEGNHVPAYTVFDSAAHVRFGAWGEGYVTVTNIFDQDGIVSLRPFGARPGAPRRITVGYKNRF